MKKSYRINETIESMESTEIQSITTEDLIALVLGNREKAERLLHQEANLSGKQRTDLSFLACQDFDSLQYLGSLTRSETARILASIELGKRIAYASSIKSDFINSPGDAAQYLMSRLRHETHEKFIVMLLNAKKHVIRVKQIAEGSLTSAVVHPREVFAQAVVAHAASILVAHNHPSGNPYPSTDDLSLTCTLAQAGEILGIPLIDHVVIGDGNYYSFKEHGEL